MLKRLGFILLVFALIWSIGGCSDDDNPVTPPQGPTYDELVSAGSAYINGTAPGVKAAADVALELDTYTILDFRSTEAYNLGHIPGALDASLGTLVSMAPTYDEGKPFLCVCYTGQGAGHAVFALKMLGYEAFSLGWGMSSWNTSLMGPWQGMVGNLATPVQTAAPELTEEYDAPVLDDYSIEARLDVVLNGGSNFISYSDMVADGLDEYFIINYFTEEQYLGGGGSPGHLDGAYQFTPKASLGADQLLKYLPNDGTKIVVYCWTGQHGSQVAAYLNMLGYDAYDLLGGSNKLWHDQLTAHKWADHTNDFPLEFTTAAQFEELAQAGEAYINGTAPGVLAAADVALELDTYTILDFRSTADYDLGHIPGAIDASTSTLLDMAATYDEGKPFLCVCYTGHAAGHAVFALKMLGYDAFSMGWGMSSWNTSLMGPWQGKINNLATPVQTAAPELTTEYSFPVLEDYSIAARLDEVLNGGSNFISYADMVTDGLENYFIINYFTEEQYLGGGGSPGHLDGAYQFTPKASLGYEQLLKYLPTDGTKVVVYCWTGQHGSQVTAYLNMLGYDAYDLLAGSNNLWHDQLTAHKWADHTNDFPLEATYDMVSNF